MNSFWLAFIDSQCMRELINALFRSRFFFKFSWFGLRLSRSFFNKLLLFIKLFRPLSSSLLFFWNESFICFTSSQFHFSWMFLINRCLSCGRCIGQTLRAWIDSRLSLYWQLFLSSYHINYLFRGSIFWLSDCNNVLWRSWWSQLFALSILRHWFINLVFSAPQTSSIFLYQTTILVSQSLTI